MKMKLLILAVLPFLTPINMNSQEEKASWVQYVNPWIGTEVWQSGPVKHNRGTIQRKSFYSPCRIPEKGKK